MLKERPCILRYASAAWGVSESELLDMFYFAYTTLGLRPSVICLHFLGKELALEAESRLIAAITEKQRRG